VPPDDANRGPLPRTPESEPSARNRHPKGSDWSSEQRERVRDAERRAARIGLVVASVLVGDLTPGEGLILSAQHAQRSSC
jgi:hypothetical protein